MTTEKDTHPTAPVEPIQHPAVAPVDTPPPDDPAPVEFEAAGRVFESAEDMVNHINEQAKLIGQQGEELGMHRKAQVAVVDDPVTATVSDEERNEALLALLLEKPAEFLTQMQTQINEGVSKVVDSRVTTATAMSEFYTRHPHLRGHERIVGIVYEDMFAEIQHDDVNDGLDKVADAVKDHVVKLAKAIGAVPKGAEEVVVSSPSDPLRPSSTVVSTPADATDATPQTLVESLRADRAARAAAGATQPAGAKK